MNKKDLLLNAVEEMLDSLFNENYGICENLYYSSEIGWLGYKSVEKFSQSWEHFSGDKHYPVSGKRKWLRFLEAHELWVGKQLELRMSLLEHIKSEVLKLSNEEFEEMFK